MLPGARPGAIDNRIIQVQTEASRKGKSACVDHFNNEVGGARVREDFRWGPRLRIQPKHESSLNW